MIISKGVKYRTVNDIKEVLFKTELAKELERSFANQPFSRNDFVPSITWTFDTRDCGFFTGTYIINAIPQDIVIENAFRAAIVPIRDNLFFISKHKQLENMVESAERYLEDKLFSFSSNREHITDNDCFIYLWEKIGYGTERLEGIYVGVPSRLLEGPLSAQIPYDCSACNHYELSSNGEIPDFYYDNKNNLYCPKCAETMSNVGHLKHIGE